MSNHITHIEDIDNEKCPKNEQRALLDIFKITIERLANTLVRKAEFDLNDYETTTRHSEIDISNFMLMIERRNINGQEQWWGDFEYKHKKLSIIGTLECWRNFEPLDEIRELALLHENRIL